jgi:hypothetical protein
VSFGDALHRYLVHPEYKSADASGRVCDKLTGGLLCRREIHVGRIRYIGKESNRLEDVQHGMVPNEDEVRTTYIDPRLDTWSRYAVPLLKHLSSKQLEKATGITSRMIKSYRKGAMPRQENRRKLVRALLKEAKSWDCNRQGGDDAGPRRVSVRMDMPAREAQAAAWTSLAV